MIFVKLKAGALQFTIFIIVVIALLLASFILIVHFHDRFKNDTALIMDAVSITNNVMHQIVSGGELTKGIDSELYKGQLIQIDSVYWGVYQTVSVTTKIKSKITSKMALIGSKQPEEHPTLFLKDNNKPLVLVGNTTIEGDVWLPNKGVRAGNISGVSYYGEQLIQGDINTISTFPEVSKHILNHLDYIKTKVSKAGSKQYLNLALRDTVQNSFFEPIKIVYEQGAINLSDIALTGNIIVYSETKIEVDVSARLTDIILIAPTIEIGNNVKGRFQALASKTIIVGNDCELSYPSALVLQPKNNLNAKSTNGVEDIMINISESSKIAGSVIYLGQEEKDNYRPQIFIDQNALVLGEVYCSGNMDLRGTIHGSVYTYNFIAAQSGSIYQNHLYNAKINKSKLPTQFSGVTFHESNKKVLKWLY